MSLIIYVFGSGFAFFGGVALVLVGIAAAWWRPRLSVVPALIGVVLITLSAVPLPYWLYALAGTATLAWLLMEAAHRKLSLAWLNMVRVTAALLWLAGAALEIPHQFAPELEGSDQAALWIVGDSVTAGVGDPKTTTWPSLLARAHRTAVHDLSQMGATVASARRRLEKEPPGAGIVILEIGGNDLLGTTSTIQFGEGLDALLALVCRPGHTVLMFELPLPPFCNEYGRIQRQLAAKYGVALIPKRILIAVLTTGDATLDSVHLTQTGHEAMAETVWALVSKACGASRIP